MVNKWCDKSGSDEKVGSIFLRKRWRCTMLRKGEGYDCLDWESLHPGASIRCDDSPQRSGGQASRYLEGLKGATRSMQHRDEHNIDIFKM